MREFTCDKCGNPFQYAWKGRGTLPHICPACQRKAKKEKDRRYLKRLKELDDRAIAALTATRKHKPAVKKCRRCGRTFAEKPLRANRVPPTSALFSHSYCPSCTWAMKRAASACDPRFAGVGGHGEIVEVWK